MEAQDLIEIDRGLANQPDAAEHWPQIKEMLGVLTSAISKAEPGMSRDEILQHIPNARMLAARSAFVRRAQEWPQGYQGDFQTINQIIEQQNLCEPGTLGHAIEAFFLDSDICQQHISKVKAQSNLIKETLFLKRSPSILSIGCGTSADLKENIPALKAAKASITLIDIDEKAIEHSMDALRPIQDQVNAIQGNVFKVAKRMRESYDLILIGGVFDYLDDRLVRSVLRSLYRNLSSDGVLFFTNIRAKNPYRLHMEYLSDWVLIERSADDLLDLMEQAGCDMNKAMIKKDETGLSLLAYAHKPSY